MTHLHCSKAVGLLLRRFSTCVSIGMYNVQTSRVSLSSKSRSPNGRRDNSSLTLLLSVIACHCGRHGILQLSIAKSSVYVGWYSLVNFADGKYSPRIRGQLCKSRRGFVSESATEKRNERSLLLLLMEHSIATR
jgi:hypothetical protein